MRPIVFLDIDGVLLPFGSYDHLDTLDNLLRHPMNYLDQFIAITPKPIIESLKNLAKEHDFVLISSWRHFFSDEFLKAYFEGIGLWQFFHEKTPIAKFHLEHSSKLRDAKEWLSLYPEAAENVTIIDDDYIGLKIGKWIKTDPYVGYIENYY